MLQMMSILSELDDEAVNIASTKTIQNTLIDIASVVMKDESSVGLVYYGEESMFHPM